TDHNVIRDDLILTTILTPNQPPSQFQSHSVATINYDHIAALNVKGGVAPNVFNIASAGAPITVSTGPGVDAVNIGSAAKALDSIQGPVTVNGQGDNTTLNVNDQGTTYAQDYEVYATT